MAPEMVIMLTQSTSEKKGYSYSVDWWSLGITMYKLLTGYRPFAPLEAANATSNPEYAMLFQEINYPKTMSPEVINIMTRLLDVNEFSRLGSGPNGHKEIKEHPFFKDIVWNMLELKHIQPPFVPQSKVLNDTPRFTSFENMLKELGKDEWLKDKIYKEEQEYFASW
jgi:serine/threonine kinase 32